MPMKWFYFILGLVCMPALKSQDTLYFVNGEKVACEVGIYDDFSIDYTPWKKTQPVYTVNTSLLDSMKFNTGEVTNYAVKRNVPSKNEVVLDSNASDDNELNDVKAFEKGYVEGLNNELDRTIGPASCAGGFCCIGITLAIPIYYSLNYDDYVPLKNKVGNSSYDRGVRAGVKKKVNRKTWGNYAGGAAIFAASYLGLVYLSL